MVILQHTLSHLLLIVVFCHEPDSAFWVILLIHWKAWRWHGGILFLLCLLASVCPIDYSDVPTTILPTNVSTQFMGSFRWSVC